MRSRCSSFRRSWSGSSSRPRPTYGEELARGLLPSADRRRGRAPPGADGRGGSRCSTPRPSRRSPGSRTCARPPRARRAAASLGPADLHARRPRGRGRRSRRGASLARGRGVAPLLRELVEPDRAGAGRRSPRRSSAASPTTAPTCATPRRRAAPPARRARERPQPRARAARALARSADLRDSLQETFVTERGGRPVLAVKASARGKVPGVVHDSSSSGQTLFVEPFAIVELTNRLAEAASAEREEVERILRELSRARRRARPRELGALVEATGALDLVLARAGLSRRWRGAAGRGGRRRAAARRAPPAARPGDGGADRPRPRRPARARRQRPEHGRQDGRAEDARARGAAPPGGPAAAGGRRRRCRCSTTCSPTSATSSRSR